MTPGPSDQAYLEYGSLTAAKSQARGPGRSGGAPRESKRPPWRQVVTVMALMAVPLGVIALVALRSASEADVLSPAELALRKSADQKACDAAGRVEAGDGSLRFDPSARDRCLIERGWELDANGQPVRCVGSCGVRDVAAR